MNIKLYKIYACVELKVYGVYAQLIKLSKQSVQNDKTGLNISHRKNQFYLKIIKNRYFSTLVCVVFAHLI